MKERYEELQCEVIAFEAQDIIVTSPLDQDETKIG